MLKGACRRRIGSEIFSDRFQAPFDVLDGRGEREAQVTFAVRPEDDARNSRDSSLHEQLFGSYTTVGIEASSFREYVEGAGGCCDFESQLVQTGAHQLAALAIFAAHLGKILLVKLESFYRGPLRRSRDTVGR